MEIKSKGLPLSSRLNVHLLQKLSLEFQPNHLGFIIVVNYFTRFLITKESAMSTKRKLLLILIAIGVSELVFFQYTTQIQSQMASLQKGWQQQNQNLLDKNNALLNLNDAMNHFNHSYRIHNTSDNVQTEQNLKLAQLLNDAQLWLTTLENLATSKSEFHALATINQIIDRHQGYLEVNKDQTVAPRKDINAQLEQDEIALARAFGRLTQTIQTNDIAVVEQLKVDYQNLNELNRLYLYIAVPIIVIIGLFFIHYVLNVTKAYRELDTMFNVSPDGFMIVEQDGSISKINPNAAQIFGYKEEELLDQSIEVLLPQHMRDNHERLRSNFQKSYSRRESVSPHTDVYGIKSDGTEIPLKIVLSTFSVSGKKKTIAVVKDVSQFKSLEALSTTDHLTGIYNRLKLDAILDSEIQRVQRYKQELSVIMCDIDYFKKINDDFGHQTGDNVLKSFSALLKRRVRNTDSVGRWGGEEFCIICPNTNLKDAFDLAENLRELIASFDFKIGRDISASFGVAHCDEADNCKSIMHKADMALYDSKQMGRNQVTLANTELTTSMTIN
jgi:diguanylate cyclase (GGDEF)-like protein/PAS domain S-box-containing protein